VSARVDVRCKALLGWFVRSWLRRDGVQNLSAHACIRSA